MHDAQTNPAGFEKDEYLGWRILGFAVAVSGAVVLSAANLVS
jgi:hypothetical protein